MERPNVHVVVLINDPLTHDSRLFKECRSLRAAGWRVSVFGNQRPEGGLPTYFRQDDCDYYRPASYPRAATIRRALWNLQAARFAMRQRPAVIVNHRYTALIPAILASWTTGSPIVYDNRELFGGGDFDLRSARYRHAFWTFESTLARACREVIMSSDGRAETWARKYGFRKPRVLYDCTERRTVACSDVLRREYGLGADDKLLLYVGSFQAGRGLMPSLEALALLPDNYYLAIMGYGDDLAEEMTARAAELGLRERFLIHPPVGWEDIPAYVSGSDLTLCLIEPISRSYVHSVPQKFYESLQAGVPVLTNDFPELRRLVQAHAVGACVPPTDIRAIARAVLDLTAGPTPADEWRRRCQRAAEALTWENEVEQLLEAVRQAADHRGPRAPR